MKQFVSCLTKSTVIIFALVTISYACWITVPIEKLVDSADVIVIATITSIEHAEYIPDGQNSAYDVGYLYVEEVLKNSLNNSTFSKNDSLPLAMPAKINVIHSSTDIYYEIGDSGIWILDFNNKLYSDPVSPNVDLFHADYIGDRMEASRREEIIEILEGRYDAEKWEEKRKLEKKNQ